jgi:hypothetical protein
MTEAERYDWRASAELRHRLIEAAWAQEHAPA